MVARPIGERLSKSVRKFLRRRKGELRRELGEQDARREIERLVRRFRMPR